MALVGVELGARRADHSTNFLLAVHEINCDDQVIYSLLY